MKQSFLESQIAEVRYEPEFLAHQAILDFIDSLVERMDKEGISKSKTDSNHGGTGSTGNA